MELAALLRAWRATRPTAAVLAVGLAIAGCGGDEEDTGDTASAQNGETTTTIRVAGIPITSNAVLELADQKGWFADEGIEVEAVRVPAPAAAMTAVEGGQADIAYAPSMPMLLAVRGGLDLKAAAPADGYPANAYQQVQSGEAEAETFDDTAVLAAGDSQIDSPADLEGKRVAVPARKAQLEITIAKAVEDDGGDPSKVNWIALGFPEMQAALDAGRVDAIGTVDPFTAQAIGTGATVVAYPGISTFEQGSVGLWTVSGSFAEENPDAVTGFRDAILKANAYANDHPDEIQELAVESTGTPLEVLRESHMPYWPTEPVDPGEIERAAKVMVDLGYLDQVPEVEQLILAE